MNYEAFRTLLSKSKIRIAVIGGVIALAGTAMLISLFMMHESKVAYWIVTGFFVVLGFFVLLGLAFYNYSLVRKMEKKIEAFVRQQAITDAEKSKK